MALYKIDTGTNQSVCTVSRRIGAVVARPPMTYDWSESWTGGREFDCTIFQITLPCLWNFVTLVLYP